jgi:predicted nucleic acid-binding protein
MLGVDETDTADLLDYVCAVGHPERVYYLWRPFLRDSKDDHLLELAVAADCEGIVTFNTRDFAGADQFGLWIMPPREFLARIGEIQ